MDIKSFLIWLSSAGGAAAALSFIAERLPAFQKLTSGQKQAVHLGGSLAIALIAYAILTYVPPEMLEQIKPIFALVAAVVGSWITGQVAHAHDPARIKAAAKKLV